MELKSAPGVTILKTRVHMSYQHQHLSLIDEGWHSILDMSCNSIHTIDRASVELCREIDQRTETAVS